MITSPVPEGGGHSRRPSGPLRAARDGPRSIGPAARAALLLGGTFVVLLPAIVAGIAILRPQWYPTGDMAQAELHVRGFWAHPPLVGAAGRIQSTAGVQGSHPGPLLWLAMWPIYALGGSTSASLVVSIVIVHLVTVVLALWLALRRGGVVFCLALGAVLALIVHAGGPDQFTEPWNPWMGLLPFLVLLLACWSILDDELWAIVLAVAAGTYSLQAHVGYVLLVGGLLSFVVAWVVVRTLRRPAEPSSASAGGRPRRQLAVWLGAAVAVGFVLWIPPILDQLRRHPGNISILIDSFGHPDAPYLGPGAVARVAVVQLNLFGPWLLGPGRADVGLGAVVGFVGFVVLWAAAVAVATRRRASSELHLHAVLAVAVVLGVASISRIYGIYFEYTVRWMWLITATVIAGSVLSLWRARPLHVRRGATIVVVAVTTVAVLIACVQFADRAGPTGAIDSEIVGGLVQAVEQGLDRHTPYLVRWSDPSTLGATGIGMVLELERRGYHVGVDPQFAAAALPHRVLPEGSAGGVLYVVGGQVAIDRARTLPDVVELGSFDVRTPAQRQRSDEVRTRLEQALVATGHGDKVGLLDAANGQAMLRFADPPLPKAVSDLIDEYVSLRLPTAVFLAPPFAHVLPLS